MNISENIIPPQWLVGLDSIDKENQSLFNYLEDCHENLSGSLSNIKFSFIEFKQRLIKILHEIEVDMEANSYRHLQYFKDANKKTISMLEGIYKKNNENLRLKCKQVLLDEVVNANLYYNNFKEYGLILDDAYLE